MATFGFVAYKDYLCSINQIGMLRVYQAFDITFTPNE